MVNNDVLKSISQLAKQQVECEIAVKKAAAELKTATAQLAVIAERLLPNAMAEAELLEFTTDTGASVSIKRDIYTSVSEERFPAAKTWLVANGYDGIIKHVVSLSFGKGENAAAEKAVTVLVEQGFTPNDKESIHHSTLKATVTELLGKGVAVPLDVFGVHEVVVAKVTL